MNTTATPVKRTIKIFARLKPCSGPMTVYDITTADHENGEDHLEITSSGYKPELSTYRFSKVFDRKCKQDYVFDQVARPVIDGSLEGFNGTIFAYGQSGSGKTFTMTGSRDVYEDRGIIPRTLEYIFQKCKEEEDSTKIRSIFISYLEIYNECGYDLLNASQTPGKLEDFGKVTLLHDKLRGVSIRNLSVHSVNSVKEALDYLYMGDHNRTIAETPLNEASTRSHCIFTIHIKIKDVNSPIASRAKLNLVDLAGSERNANTGITGQLQNEAKHINLALHYLEQVIVALSDPSRVHVPYRNSMMTSILRDSLGGNCMTTMIATLSMEAKNAQETLSTCRFAQRVALVTNTLAKNEVVEAIESESNIQLKQEVKKLKQILSSSAVKPLSEVPQPLNAEEKEDCRLFVQQYLCDSDSEATLTVAPDMRLIQECFRLLKPSAARPFSNFLENPDDLSQPPVVILDPETRTKFSEELVKSFLLSSLLNPEIIIEASCNYRDLEILRESISLLGLKIIQLETVQANEIQMIKHSDTNDVDSKIASPSSSKSQVTSDEEGQCPKRQRISFETSVREAYTSLPFNLVMEFYDAAKSLYNEYTRYLDWKKNGRK